MNTDNTIAYISSMLSSESSFATLMGIIDDMGLEVMDVTIS